MLFAPAEVKKLWEGQRLSGFFNASGGKNCRYYSVFRFNMNAGSFF